MLGTDRAKLPLPDPSDIQQAGLVSFEDIDKELKQIRRDFNSECSLFYNSYLPYFKKLFPSIIN